MGKSFWSKPARETASEPSPVKLNPAKVIELNPVQQAFDVQARALWEKQFHKVAPCLKGEHQVPSRKCHHDLVKHYGTPGKDVSEAPSFQWSGDRTDSENGIWSDEKRLPDHTFQQSLPQPGAAALGLPQPPPSWNTLSQQVVTHSVNRQCEGAEASTNPSTNMAAPSSDYAQPGTTSEASDSELPSPPSTAPWCKPPQPLHQDVIDPYDDVSRQCEGAPEDEESYSADTGDNADPSNADPSLDYIEVPPAASHYWEGRGDQVSFSIDAMVETPSPRTKKTEVLYETQETIRREGESEIDFKRRMSQPNPFPQKHGLPQWQAPDPCHVRSGARRRLARSTQP